MSANASMPLDVETMRATTAVILADDAELPTEGELNDLVLLYRGHLMLLIPEVERAAYGRPVADAATAGALAGVAEARQRLNDVADGPLPRRAAHAQRLARSVVRLLAHLPDPKGGRCEP